MVDALGDVAIVGGGPGGLYLAILLKRDRPGADVRVYERNRPDDTYGFGVAFHEQTLLAFADADAPSRAALDGLLTPWDDVLFSVRGYRHRVSGHGFAGCSRHRLLAMLQSRAVELGVGLEFEADVPADELPPASLVVAADGAGSRIRTHHAEHFQPTVDVRPNRFVWLGTMRPLDAMSFLFAETPFGVFVAHAYPHTRELGTWIVEANADTFEASGLADMSERESADFLQGVFAEFLDGHELIVNHSHWRQFPSIRCTTWVKDNLVLLGDAKATVHYSIGSGTKIAMEDAVSLHDALVADATIPGALARYERERRPAVERLQSIAYGSMRWFETFGRRWSAPPAQFVLSGVTRKANETFATVGAKSAELTHDAVRSMPGAGHRTDAARPVDVPVDLGSARLPGRVVALSQATLADGSSAWIEPVASGAGAPPVRLPVVGVGGLDAAAAATAVTAFGGECGVLLDAADDALAVAAACVKAGAAFVVVAGPSQGPSSEQRLLADLVRHELGVASIVAVDDLDDADTALATGRADLVVVTASDQEER